MSIVDNTQRAIQSASGEYLCFIGDDDFVSPHILQAVLRLRASGLGCLSFPPARYWWPNVHFARPTATHHACAFWLPKSRDGSSRVRHTGEELERLLASGGMNYSRLPRFYHGIVKRDVLLEIQQRSGRWVPGASPDMAFSVALCLVTERYLELDLPVTVFGASRGSGGGRTAEGRHHGQLEQQAHLPRETIDGWDPRLPRVWSEQTIYPQTIHEVMRRFHQQRSIDVTTFYAAMMVGEPHLWRTVAPLVRRHVMERPSRLLPLSASVLKKVGGRCRRAWQSRFRRSDNDIFEIGSVDEGMRLLAKFEFDPR
jgi:hypothetical protein